MMFSKSLSFSLLFSITSLVGAYPLSKRDEVPFTLDNQGLYDDLVLYSNYAGAAYCINTLDGVTPGYLNSACQGVDCTNADSDVYVVEVVKDVANALVLAQNSTKEIIISFQGSSTLLDWILDFTFVASDFEGFGAQHGLSVNTLTAEDPQVHTGFHVATTNFFDNAINVLTYLKEKYPDYQVITTGHSLGGALSSLAGLELYLMGFNPSIVSFAGPKVFNPSLAHYVDQVFNTDSYVSNLESNSVSAVQAGTYSRVTHLRDIVPCVPLVSMGYEHAGCEFYIKEPYIPQPMDSVIVRGTFQEKYELQTLGSNVARILLDPFGALQDFIIVTAHNYYFSVITECNGLMELIGLDGNPNDKK